MNRGKTQTVELETSDYFISAEVNQHGNIITATEYSYAFDEHIDCLERIENQESQLIAEAIKKEYENLDWHGSGEDPMESSKNWEIKSVEDVADALAKKLIG